MLITQILGNIGDMPESLPTDTIEIEWYNTQKRIARYTSLHGREFAFRFEKPLQIGLSHGDIIEKTESNLTTIAIKPTHILTMRTESAMQIAQLCYEIGNYHAPLFLGANMPHIHSFYNENIVYGEVSNKNPFVFCTPFEKPIKALLERLQVMYSEEEGILDSKKRLRASMIAKEPKLERSKDFSLSLTKKASAL